MLEPRPALFAVLRLAGLVILAADDEEIELRGVVAAELGVPENATVEQLRAMRGQIGEVTPLTGAERHLLRRRAKTSNPVLQASINMIGAHDQVSLAVAQKADGVRRLHDEATRCGSGLPLA